ncbi:ankyrin repeat domain-containing protein [bacterium]|nr:ankyrin repeat domain-containing protein [bacterium]
MADQPEDAPVYFNLIDLCKAPNATPEQVQEFVDLRVDVNAKDDRNLTAVLYAAEKNENPEIVKLLIKAGANTEAEDGRGSTPIHHAAHLNDNPHVLEILIKAGANLNATNSSGTTPLDLAEWNKKTKHAELLRAAGGKRSTDLP